MGLQVWLPLNGDVKNQGLMDTSPQAVGSGTWENGKIGKCYNGGGNGYVFINTPIAINGPFSIAFWLKVNSFNAAWGRVFRFTKSTNEYLGMCYSNTNSIGFHISDDIDGTRTSICDSYKYIPVLGEWAHMTIVFDGETTIKWYKDGVLHATQPTSMTFSGDIYTKLGICANASGANKADCSVNDFRIYDYALSPREVKEISKGLVLHYPLSMPGQENLLQGDLNNVSQWSVGSGSTKVQMEEDGFNCIEVYSTGNTGMYVSRNIILQANTTYTYSFDIKSAIDRSFSFSSVGHYQVKNSSISGDAGLHQDTNRVFYPTTLRAGKWTHCSITFDTLSESQVFSAYIWYLGSSGESGCVFVKNVKLERGSIATPWIPNSADTAYTTLGFNDGIEYDVSGFGNNGTKHGTITYDADTPRYETSAVFNGSSDIRSAKSSFGWFDFKEGTVAAWFKPANTTQQWASVGVQNDGGQGSRSFSICNYSGKAATVVGYDSSWGYQSSDYSMSANVWYHLCATITNGDTVKLYVNGELVQTRTVTNTTGTIASTTQFAVGVDLPGSDERFTGHLSDVRFYTTCLKESDVRELYNTSMSLSNNGVLFGYEFIE